MRKNFTRIGVSALMLFVTFLKGIFSVSGVPKGKTSDAFFKVNCFALLSCNFLSSVLKRLSGNRGWNNDFKVNRHPALANTDSNTYTYKFNNDAKQPAASFSFIPTSNLNMPSFMKTLSHEPIV